jgi:hypothetical protein
MSSVWQIATSMVTVILALVPVCVLKDGLGLCAVSGHVPTHAATADLAIR